MTMTTTTTTTDYPIILAKMISSKEFIAMRDAKDLQIAKLNAKLDRYGRELKRMYEISRCLREGRDIV